MRSESQEAAYGRLLATLDRIVGVPGVQELREINQRMDDVAGIPMTHEERMSMLSKVHAINERFDPVSFAAGVGQHLEQFRHEVGLSLREAAAQVQMTPAELRQFEQGLPGLTLLDATKLARIYTVAIDDLVAGLR